MLLILNSILVQRFHLFSQDIIQLIGDAYSLSSLLQLFGMSLIYILKDPFMSNFILTSTALRTSGEAHQVNRACPSMEGRVSKIQ